MNQGGRRPIVVWCSPSKLQETHAYAANRSQDTFYNAEGTISVSVTGISVER